MAAAHVDNMRALGLHGLAPSEAYAAFAEAGYAARSMRAGIAASRFRAVNTAKGPWSFLRQLAAVPAAAGLSAEAAAAEASTSSMQALPQQLEDTAAAAAAAAAASQPALALAEVTARVQAAAEECIGADGIEGGGRFAPGAFDSLSAVELANSLGKVSRCKVLKVKY